MGSLIHFYLNEEEVWAALTVSVWEAWGVTVPWFLLDLAFLVVASIMLSIASGMLF